MSERQGLSEAIESGSEAARRRRRWHPAYLVVGLALLSNGAALVLHIVQAVPLPPLLLVLWGGALVAIAVSFVRADPEVRGDLRRTFVIGVVAGLIATIAYDVSKALLSQLDPSPWNPFEATRIFGLILLGDGVDDTVLRLTGWAFHFSNGATFGMSFAFVFGGAAVRSVLLGVLLGAAWGVGLETFQLTLYPGWLGIPAGNGALAEFQQVSFLGHLVFGSVLGLLVRRWLIRYG
jgi:hypothetical protein